MTLTQREMEKKVGRILEIVQMLTVADGIDVLASSLASSLVLANASGLLDKDDLKVFMSEFEERINKTLKVLDPPKRDIRLKRSN